MVKNLPASAEDTRDAGSIPGSGRSPGGGNGNPHQCSYLEKSYWQRKLIHNVALVSGIQQNDSVTQIYIYNIYIFVY